MNQRSLSIRSLALPLLLAAASSTGCATVTGTVTGAFTGLVDLPREIIDENRLAADSADTWAVALIAAPIGVLGGPFLGFVKGFGLDVSAINGSLTLSDEFKSYDRTSVWRPYTFGWE